MHEEDVERQLIGLTQARPAGASIDPDDLRISPAGTQEKTALLQQSGGWMRLHGQTSTTHVLELPLGLIGHCEADLSASVEKERLCMNLQAQIGLPVAHTAILKLGSQKVLGVERFDRQPHPSDSQITRLQQENLASRQCTAAP